MLTIPSGCWLWTAVLAGVIMVVSLPMPGEGEVEADPSPAGNLWQVSTTRMINMIVLVVLVMSELRACLVQSCVSSATAFLACNVMLAVPSGLAHFLAAQVSGGL